MTPLGQARLWANELVRAMEPYCEKIRVAGSIRRECATVKDIEIVCTPKLRTVSVLQQTLFGETEPERTYEINELHSWATNNDLPLDLQWIKPGTSEISIWSIKSTGKYWRGYLPAHDMKVDVFIATPENLGAILLIRTGSAEFSQGVMEHAKRISRPCCDGQFTSSGIPRVTPTEQDVFELLGLRYVAPLQRRGRGDVRRK